MSKSKNNGTSRTSAIILIGYLISSVFAGLIFSGIALRSRNQGNTGIGWGLLSLVCIGIFGFMGYAFFKTSSPLSDAFYYYLGIVTLVANSLALIILFLAFFKRR
jgi:hypothetical protein